MSVRANEDFFFFFDDGKMIWEDTRCFDGDLEVFGMGDSVMIGLIYYGVI